MTPTIKTTAFFQRPFQLPSFNETLPPGDYEIETRLIPPVDPDNPGTWASSVQVQLHPRASHPGLDRTLTVPLAELEHAMAKDKLTGRPLTDFFLEDMLADPMIRLVMLADGVAEADLRALYAPGTGGRPADLHTLQTPETPQPADEVTDAPRYGGQRPGIGE